MDHCLLAHRCIPVECPASRCTCPTLLSPSVNIVFIISTPIARVPTQPLLRLIGCDGTQRQQVVAMHGRCNSRRVTPQPATCQQHHTGLLFLASANLRVSLRTLRFARGQPVKREMSIAD
ncbi:unnamed protein product [Mesocestoides corti]|uniref:Uncharacterized protein n=1 Tax=Mesocestoides corti TaxID=53468 RepID=A0A0R3U8M0_MESCO|nr:unnamed protein product [Mesocestoides corti]